METETKVVLDCGHLPSARVDATATVGYGTNKDGKRHCYACCGERDRTDMIASGRVTLYLIPREHKPADRADFVRYEVINWPGSLRFSVRISDIRHGRHNIAGTRTDVWFLGPDGATWHGVNYGENTDIVHCRRVKK